VRVEIDTRNLRGTVDLVAPSTSAPGGWEAADAELASRAPRPDLAADPDLPADTRLWAALQTASGGVWSGSVYDVDKIVATLEAGRRALEGKTS
jgi:hypothetical protein